MKIRLKYLKISDLFVSGKNEKNKELEKFLASEECGLLLRTIIKFTNNELTTEQVDKFIAIKSFNKIFKGKKEQVTVKFIFSTYGDLVLEIIQFGKRDMYKEMEIQQKFGNFNEGLIRDDKPFF